MSNILLIMNYTKYPIKSYKGKQYTEKIDFSIEDNAGITIVEPEHTSIIIQ